MRSQKVSSEYKDMSDLREADSAFVQSRTRRGALRDYSLKHTAEISWDLNDEGTRDRMVKIKIDEKEIIVDTEQLLRYLRWV